MSQHYLLCKKTVNDQFYLTGAFYETSTFEELKAHYETYHWWESYTYLALIPRNELPEDLREEAHGAGNSELVRAWFHEGRFNPWLFSTKRTYSPAKLGAKPRTWAHGEVWATRPVSPAVAWNAILIASGDPRAVREET